MNENKPLDRRIQRTRPLLQEALFHLIIEHGYEHITIADITERANLGRTTFYLHYRDKENLLRESIKGLLHDLHLEVEPDTQETSTYDVMSIRIFQHIARQQQVYQAMLKEAGPSKALGDGMRTYFTELCQRFLQGTPLKIGCSSSVSSEIFAAHAAGSLFGLLSWWLDHETSPSAEEMGTIYWQLMAKENRDLL